MAEILDFTGITKSDLEPDAVLEAAKGKVLDVIVLGYDENGEEYFASAKADVAAILWLLKRYEKHLLELPEMQGE